MQIAGNTGIDVAMSRLVAAPICRLLIEDYLKGSKGDADAYLRSLGVVDGTAGLNFDASTLFHDGSTIKLTVIYKVTLKFPFFYQYDFTMKANACTAVWGSELRLTQE